MTALAHRFELGYPCAKSSSSCEGQSLKKTVVGIGLLVESAAQSRNRKPAAFSFLAPFMAVQARSRKARQLPLRGFTGRPTRLDCRPDWSRCGSHSTTEPSEAIMAKSSSGKSAQSIRCNSPGLELLERIARANRKKVSPSDLPKFDRLMVAARQHLRDTAPARPRPVLRLACVNGKAVL